VAGLHAHRKDTNQRELVRNEARAHFRKDQAFRAWGAAHGGVYVPPTRHTPPNPHLSRVPGRDVETTDGQKLTLMNPAYMVRQMMEDFGALYGIRGRITSLKPLRPENAPDEWERAALESFETGVTEVSEFADLDGEPYLRLMRPMIVTQPCLKCHEWQGYEKGDVRGGVGLSVPAGPAFARARRVLALRSSALGLLWLIGLAVIVYGATHIRRRVRERDRAERALTSERRRLASTVQGTHAGTWEWNVQSGKTVFNDRWAQIVGYSLDDLQPTSIETWNSLVHPDDLKKSREQLERHFSRETAHFDCEFRMRHKEGHWVWVHGRGQVLTWTDDDRPLMMYGIHTDITARRRTAEEKLEFERQVQHAQKLESLGVLAGGIAHDFNNLLMTILGNADLALCELSPTSPAHRNIREIEKASQRAAELAKQMLAYSGRGRFTVEPIDLGTLVQELAHLLEVSISKKVALRYDFAAGLPTFDGDVTQVRQVVMNLITNAAEAIGDGSGDVILSTGAMYCDRAYLDDLNEIVLASLDEPLPEGVYTYVEVVDAGCGMNAATLAKVFDPFFTTKAVGGRGLGMSAVLGIVRAHRGTLKIHSEVGKGTTFKVLFPANDPSDREPSAREEAESEEVHEREAEWERRCDGGTVLVVDDEETVREVGRRMLERMGFDVLTAANGREALEIFRARCSEIDCVLLDLTMPDMDGEEAFRDMRRLRPGVRVLLCSGYDARAATERLSGKGLVGFLQKPYDMLSLQAKITEILRAR